MQKIGGNALAIMMMLWSTPYALASIPQKVDHWIQRLENNIRLAGESGRVPGSELARLEFSLRVIKAKRDEAMEDGKISAKELQELRQLISVANMEVAEVRFGPKLPEDLLAADDAPRRPRPKHKDEDAGAHTIIGAH